MCQQREKNGVPEIVGEAFFVKSEIQNFRRGLFYAFGVLKLGKSAVFFEKTVGFVYFREANFFFYDFAQLFCRRVKIGAENVKLGAVVVSRKL